MHSYLFPSELAGYSTTDRPPVPSDRKLRKFCPSLVLIEYQNAKTASVSCQTPRYLILHTVRCSFPTYIHTYLIRNRWKDVDFSLSFS